MPSLKELLTGLLFGGETRAYNPDAPASIPATPYDKNLPIQANLGQAQGISSMGNFSAKRLLPSLQRMGEKFMGHNLSDEAYNAVTSGTKNLLALGSLLGLNDPSSVFGGAGSAIKAAGPIARIGSKVDDVAAAANKMTKGAGTLADVMPAQTWENWIGKKIPHNKLGDEMYDVADLSRGWITPEGKLYQVTESHPASLAAVTGVPNTDMIQNYQRIAGDQGLVRLMTSKSRAGIKKFAEVYDDISDVQLRKLREIEKNEGVPLEFAFVDSKNNKLIGRAEGVNQIRGMIDKYNNPVDFKKLGAKVKADDVSSGFLLDDGSFINKPKTETHAQAITRAAGLDKPDPRKLPEFANKTGMARIHIDKTQRGSSPYVEFFAPPTDAQLAQLRELEKLYDVAIPFDIASQSGTLLATGEGVNKIRRAIQDMNPTVAKHWNVRN